MTNHTKPAWHRLRTAETRAVEVSLLPHFAQVDAYRYNPGSIRVRLVDPRFRGATHARRAKAVDAALAGLSDDVQSEIVFVLPAAAEELTGNSNWAFLNAEFEDPSPSTL